MVDLNRDRMVYVPCRLNRRDARSAHFEDADGSPVNVVSPLGRVGRRLCVAAQWLRSAAGRQRVRFEDGAELWISCERGEEERFIPFGTRSIVIADLPLMIDPTRMLDQPSSLGD